MANVLLIDDDVTSCTLLTDILAGAGHGVTYCTTAVAGIRLLASRRYDVVVTDILMPRMDGLEAIRAITASHPDLPVVAISGGGSHGFDFLHAAKTFGAAAVLRKPIRRCELQDVIARLVEAAAAAPQCMGRESLAIEPR